MKLGKVLTGHVLERCTDIDERVSTMIQAIVVGDVLLASLDKAELLKLEIKIENHSEKLLCIPAYLSQDAVPFGYEQGAWEWINVELLIKTLILSEELDALLIRDAFSRTSIITKAMAQRILEPFVKEKEVSFDEDKCLNKAVKYITIMHMGQTEKERMTPFIVHPLEVMTILKSMDADINLLIAGLLHDAVKETEASILDIERQFGLDVAALVAAQTENKRWRLESQERYRIDESEYGSDRMKMLVMAETVANQRTILHVFNDEGEKVWDRFTLDKVQQARHYSLQQDALLPMLENEKTKKVYWEMVSGYKDIFVTYYLNVTEYKLFQLSSVEGYVFKLETGRWESIPLNENIMGIQITRTFAETIEDAWTLEAEEKRQWKEWMFRDVDGPSEIEMVKDLIRKLQEMGMLRYDESVVKLIKAEQSQPGEYKDFK